MSAPVRLSCLAALLTLPLSVSAAAPPMANVLAEFVVARDGEPIVIPVTIQGKSYPFLVDTGATRSYFDQKLRPLLGKGVPGGVMTTTGGGDTRLPLAMPPTASVGRLPFPGDQAIVVNDLTPSREARGVELWGVLGMDFLSNYVVRIDCDRGRLALARSPGRHPGHPLPLEMRQGVPFLEVNVTGFGPGESFLVDTGCTGSASGGMDEEVYARLELLRRLATVTRRTATTHAGRWETRIGRLAGLRIGPFEHRDLLFGRLTGINCLGLNFWARYTVTLDFPARVLYLRKGRGHAGPDPMSDTGMQWIWRNGRPLVESVETGSPAARAGIRRGDEVMSIDGHKAGACTKKTMELLLCGEGRKVRLVIRRGDEVRDVPLRLKIGWRTAKEP